MFTHQVVKFIDQLNDADDLAQRVLNGHAEDGFVLERCVLINTGIKARILVSIWYGYSLRKFVQISASLNGVLMCF